MVVDPSFSSLKMTEMLKAERERGRRRGARVSRMMNLPLPLEGEGGWLG